MSATHIAFAGAGLDRADHIRSDPDALAALMDWRARLLRLDGLDPQIDPDGNLSWGTLADAAPTSELVFLGLAQGKACFAEVAASLLGSVAPANPRLWAAMSALDSAELATYGTARALVDWHARHRYCARCGCPTTLAKGGWQRSCTNAVCKGEHFPRVDPVTIMLVEHQGMLLLGRQPRFPPRRYSALAGFLEPGESIEEAVAREVLEEAGVVVRDVSYVASQPWPFPSSLMIGCHSYTDNADLTVDRTELEEADWFSRAEIAAAMAGDESGRLLTPPSQAIAHHLLKWWLAK
ncbi:NAD(+) diphosphatase [Novosphingobium sp.]|uniref:NAD(+) diphosphatase n=1 Tax=Novosphingobium sp. TaxID=1874826 RepID=UPI00286B9287|nr:NAD(+) diphosphatase [Novosphingobium sp.]